MKSLSIKVCAAALALMPLAACGNLSNSSSDSGGKGKGDLVVGVVIDRTGRAKSVDGNLLAGAQTAVDRINADGGVKGRKLRLVVRDDAGDPARAVQGLQYVQQYKPAAVLTGFLSAVTAALAPVAKSNSVPLIAGSVLPDQDKDFVFSTLIPVKYETGTRVEWLASKGYKRIAVLHDPTPYNLAQLEVLKSQLTAAGLQMVSAVEHGQEDVDLRAQISQVMKSKPDALVKLSSGPTFVPATKALSAAGANFPVVFGFESGDNIRAAASEYSNLFQVVTGIEISDQLGAGDVSAAAAAFLKATASNAAVDQPVYAGRGWDAIYLLKDALEKSDGARGAKLRDALVDLPPYAGTSSNYDFTADDHDGVTTNPEFVVSVDSQGDRKLVFRPKK